jgi:hypothetical protein
MRLSKTYFIDKENNNIEFYFLYEEGVNICIQFNRYNHTTKVIRTGTDAKIFYELCFTGTYPVICKDIIKELEAI